MKAKRGQALIEGIVGLGTFLSLAFGGLFLFYYLSSQLWIQNSLYESLFCVAKGHEVDVCKVQTLSEIKKLVVWGKIKNFKLNKRGRTWKGSLEWDLGFLDSILFQRKLTIPTDFLREKFF